MTSQLDRPALAAGIVALASAVGTAIIAPDAESLTIAALAPSLYVVAGLLGPIWRAARFVCRLLVASGSLHLIAFGLSALALGAPAGGATWHVLSQLLYVAGFGMLVMLAAGYPSGPSAVWSKVLAVVACTVPVLAGLAGPTPPVLGGAGDDTQLGPVFEVLPVGLASAAGIVFALPVVAVGVVVVRFVRGDRDLRGRLALPLAALAALAAVVVVGVMLPAAPDGLVTALFLVTAPSLPVALVAGSRPSSVSDAGARRARIPALSDTRLETLTAREREVLTLMAEGRSNAAIGKALHISLSAVEKHSSAIFTKLQLDATPHTHRRVSAVVAYLRGMD